MNFDNIGESRRGIVRLPHFGLKGALLGAAAAFVLYAAWDSYYTVSPTELAGVRRLDSVVSTEPVGPGPHLKLPFIETVDRLQVSLSKFGVKDLEVYTVDNQPITIAINMTYDIQRDHVFHLLYDVGHAGSFDIWDNVEPVIADRAMRVFSQENTVTISEDRSKLAAEIQKSVQTAIGPLFGIQVRDLQITSIQYSPSFEASINAAVTAKNRAIQAENQVNQIKYEAEQAKIRAEGRAQAAIAKAEGARQAAILAAQGASQSTVLRAQGQAKATLLNGEAQAKAIQAVGAAVAENPQIVQDEVAKGWDGHTPGVIVGDHGSVPLLNLQVRQPAQQASR